MSNGIYKAITETMAEIQPIAKGKRNEQQGFKYRGIDDVMNELNPILVKHKIFIIPEVISMERSIRETNKGETLNYSILTIKYFFVHEDGSEVFVTVVGEGMDSGDKASNKAMAVALKYACLQMFCIPTEDMPDPDNITPLPNKPLEPKNEQNSPQTGAPDTQKAILLEELGQIMNKTNPDNKTYFTESEKKNEWIIFKNAPSINTINLQIGRLKKELATREDKYLNAIPFGNDKEFKDDYPFDDQKQELEIH